MEAPIMVEERNHQPPLGDIERRLIALSHDSASADKLADRYSVRDGNRPYLNLQPAARQLDVSTTQPKQEAEVRRRKVSTRTELRKFIKDAVVNTRRSRRHPECLKKVPDFKDLSPMVDLWKQYMTNLLFPSGHNGVISSSHLNKLSTADYHGAYLTVASSRNPSQVGISGIVLVDGRSSFVLVVREEPWRSHESTSDSKPRSGGVKVIEKKGAQFRFSVPIPGGLTLSNQSQNSESINMQIDEQSVSFCIIGSRFRYRTADRSNRKFKGHSVDDI